MTAGDKAHRHRPTPVEGEGTFVVVEADEESALLRAVDTGQVVTLAANPGVTAGEVVEATVEPAELGLVYTATVDERIEVAVEAVDEPPTDRALEAAREADPGELRSYETDAGVVHVLAVPPERTAAAVQDVLEDTETVARAARLGADRVEVRSETGVLAVRYGPGR